MRCSECDGEYDSSFAFCPYCGKKEHEPEIKPPEQQPHKPPEKKKETTVLIVDDDEGMIKTLSLSLRLAGYKVIAAQDGEQAVMITHRKRPGVILLDIAMPGLHGFAVIDKIRQSAYIKNTPIVIISAYTSQEYKDRAAELGIADYITKPYKPEEVVEAIERVVND